MRIRGRRAAGLALAAGALACEPGPLVWGTARHFEELDADAAAGRVERDDEAWLVQVRRTDSGDRRIPGAEILSPDAAHAGLGPRARTSVVVVGANDAVTLGFAAQLTRAGCLRVVAVRGGVDAWLRSTDLPAAIRSERAIEGRARAAERR